MRNERKEEGTLVKKIKVIFYKILIVVMKILQMLELERKRRNGEKEVKEEKEFRFSNR
jgi:hypothetical protein